MNLVLIGYRGTGKSEVARLLGRRLSMPVVSLDAEIVREAGLSIPQIVERHGWPWFRDLEAELTKRYSQHDRQILDTGGGVILREDNVAHLQSNGRVFWLQASADVIVSRIHKSANRPALTQGKTFTEEVTEVLAQRLPLYQAAANFCIDTDNRTPRSVTNEVARLFKQALKEAVEEAAGT